MMTGLIPWRRKPENSSVLFNRDINSAVEHFFKEPFLSGDMFADSNKWLPSIDIRDKDKEIIVNAEIPGMRKEDLDVSLKGRFLTISGEKTTDEKKVKQPFFRRERSYGYFERTILLPGEVDDVSAKAKYKRGVLTLNMKKTGTLPVKSIPVRIGTRG